MSIAAYILGRIDRTDRLFHEFKEFVMASIEEIRAEVAEVKQNLTDQADALSTIVARIASLEEQIAGGLTAEQAEEVLAEVRSIKEGTQAVEDQMRAAGTTPQV